MSEKAPRFSGGMRAKNIYSVSDNIDNMDKGDKVKVQLDKDIVNTLIKLKRIGDTYSDVLRELLRKK